MEQFKNLTTPDNSEEFPLPSLGSSSSLGFDHREFSFSSKNLEINSWLLDGECKLENKEILTPVERLFEKLFIQKKTRKHAALESDIENDDERQNCKRKKTNEKLTEARINSVYHQTEYTMTNLTQRMEAYRAQLSSFKDMQNGIMEYEDTLSDDNATMIAPSSISPASPASSLAVSPPSRPSSSSSLLDYDDTLTASSMSDFDYDSE